MLFRSSNQYGRSREEREELHGICMEAVWRAKERLSSNYPDPDGYLYRAMENAACDYRRRGPGKQRSHYSLFDPDEHHIDPKAELSFQRVEDSDIYRDFFSRLRKRDRRLLKLVLEGKSSTEIGRALKPKQPLRASSVRTLLSRKRQEWQRIFQSL